MDNQHTLEGEVDLSFISTVLRPFSTWQLHTDLTSDHFATRTKIDIQTLPPIPPPPPRWNQDLADWNIFQSELEKWANEYDPPQDMDQLELDLKAPFTMLLTRQWHLKQGVITLTKTHGTIAQRSGYLKQD